MKRFISSFIAAIMVVATTTAFAADYTVTLSLDYEDAVTSTTLKKDDEFEVYARLNDSLGIASKNLQIAYDPAVLAPVADPDTLADAEDFGVDPTLTHIVYEYFLDYDGVNRNAKWGDIMIGSGDVNTDKFVSFVGARAAATTRSEEDMLIGAVRFKVLDDSVKSTEVYISAFDITSDGSTKLDADITSKVVVNIEGSAPSIVEATKEVEYKNNKADKAEGEAYTQGFKVTVTGNDQVVTAVPFTLTADGTTKAFAGFTGLEITGATPAVLGLNVKKVPADKTVTAEFSLTIAE